MTQPFNQHFPGLSDFSDPSSALLDNGAASGAGFSGLPDGDADFVQPAVLADADAYRHSPGGNPNPSTPVTPFTPPVEPASPTPFTIAISWDSSVVRAARLYQRRPRRGEFPRDPVHRPGHHHRRRRLRGGRRPTIGPGDLGESLSNMVPGQLCRPDRRGGRERARRRPTPSVVASFPPRARSAGPTTGSPPRRPKLWGWPPPSNSGTVDGSIGFGPRTFTYGDTNAGGTVAAGTYDFFATAVHEITEVMGRQWPSRFGGRPVAATPAGLLGAGTRDLSQSTPGTSRRTAAPPTSARSIRSREATPEIGRPRWSMTHSMRTRPPAPRDVSANDLTEMDAIGWKPAGSSGTHANHANHAPHRPPQQRPPHRRRRRRVARPGSVSPVGAVPGDRPGVRRADRRSPADRGRGDRRARGQQVHLHPRRHRRVVVQPDPDQFSGGAGGRCFGATGTTGGTLYALTVTATDETASGHPCVRSGQRGVRR